MPSLKTTLMQLRILHAVFVTTWFLFLVVIHQVSPLARPVPLVLVAALALVSFTNVAIALSFRTQYITRSEDVLRNNPADSGALTRWRSGNVLSFVFAEATTLFGLLLKFMGADWKTAGPFFALGLLLLLLWFPRLDFEPA